MSPFARQARESCDQARPDAGHAHPFWFMSVEVSVASTRLPGDFHSDPAHRIIVATTRHLGATLVTEDKRILHYSKAGHVKSHRAGV